MGCKVAKNQQQNAENDTEAVVNAALQEAIDSVVTGTATDLVPIKNAADLFQQLGLN